MKNPYPHEHSVRITEPSHTRYIRFRRQNGKFGKGISAIWGVLRKKIDGAKTELQAIRFDARKFTPAKVRSWVDAHGGRGKGFQVEPATAAYDRVGEVYAGNPVTLKSWLMKMYREEKQGIKEYEKLYRHVGEPGIKKVLKRIISDEKKHVKMLARVYASLRVSSNPPYGYGTHEDEDY